MTARSKKYSIPLLVYTNKEDFHPVADDGMLIRNHNFHRSVELVSADSLHGLSVLFSNFWSFLGCDSHPEHGPPGPKVPVKPG